MRNSVERDRKLPIFLDMKTMTTSNHMAAPESSHQPAWYDLADDAAYRQWRDDKLEGYPEQASDLLVEIDDWRSPTKTECSGIASRCRKANMAVYSAGSGLGKEDALELARAFGLSELDIPLYTDEPGVTEITKIGEGRQGEYAPYTDRSLSWHTDGYYNTAARQVRGMLLHCARPAPEGGLSSLLDPEIAYIRLRDENPDFISALMEPDALTIPKNVEQGVLIRPDSVGPVFSVINGQLHMRFTARKRYVEWKAGVILDQARVFLRELLGDDDGPVLHHKLAAGEGLICNNVLHTRNAFTDDRTEGRLLYRARFLDRVPV